MKTPPADGETFSFLEWLQSQSWQSYKATAPVPKLLSDHSGCRPRLVSWLSEAFENDWIGVRTWSHHFTGNRGVRTSILAFKLVSRRGLPAGCKVNWPRLLVGASEISLTKDSGAGGDGQLPPGLANSIRFPAGLMPVVQLTRCGETALRWHREGNVTPNAGPGKKRRLVTMRRRVRRHRGKGERPLTTKQAETVQIVGECKGNIAQAARRLGRDRKTVEQSYRAGIKKLGRQAVPKPKTGRLPADRRGQESIASNEDRRL